MYFALCTCFSKKLWKPCLNGMFSRIFQNAMEATHKKLSIVVLTKLSSLQRKIFIFIM